MIGYLLYYKQANPAKKTKLYYAIFGRNLYRMSAKGNKYAYHVPGMISDTRFIRLSNGKIFLEKIDDFDLPKLSLYGNVRTEPVDMEIIGEFITGTEHLKKKAQERGYDFHG